MANVDSLTVKLHVDVKTLRDEFAMAIMGGFAANASELVLSKTPRQCAEYAYKCADAMMEARKS